MNVLGESILVQPRSVFKQKRAITSAEHEAIVARELNPERHDFYELLWHTGASQTDAAGLTAEDINWQTRTLSYCRNKLKSRAGIKPALIRFGDDVASILQRRPQAGPLFPYLRTVRPGNRATEFKQRCQGLKISGVTLHSTATPGPSALSSAAIPSDSPSRPSATTPRRSIRPTPSMPR
jgi:integrase